MTTFYSNPDTLFTEDGELSQVAYAREAVTTAETVIAVLENDQISLWAERKELPLLRPQNRITQIDDKHNIFIACAGLPADARVIVDRARQHCQSHKLNTDESLTVEGIARFLAQYKQSYTQQNGFRPFGVSSLVCGYDDKPHIYEIDPSGDYWEFKARAIGRFSDKLNDVLDKNYSNTDIFTKIEQYCKRFIWEKKEIVLTLD
ncbi:uncharacterized protein LOC105212807 [Zeugodacus cucurbitae]|uniref:uncharacterized protein LOC105212807 n=1 Tax=Zeugodacus cucurbitae TaxID=28588 RepID=UPI0005969BD2|nr:uncharacterized protein LOC105212807 [Zeugodacus cucurbitae]